MTATYMGILAFYKPGLEIVPFLLLVGLALFFLLPLLAVSQLDATVRFACGVFGWQGMSWKKENTSFCRFSMVFLPCATALVCVGPAIFLTADGFNGLVGIATIVLLLAGRWLWRSLDTEAGRFASAAPAAVLAGLATMAWAAAMLTSEFGLAAVLPAIVSVNYFLLARFLVRLRPAMGPTSGADSHDNSGDRLVRSGLLERWIAMSKQRLVAMFVLFGAVTVAWMVLGTTLLQWTNSLADSLGEEVTQLWGPSDLRQVGPTVTKGNGRAELLGSDVQVAFEHENRYKGLLWFSTYTVHFTGVYTVSGGAAGDSSPAEFRFPLPWEARHLTDLQVTLDGEPWDTDETATSSGLVIPLPPGESARTITVSYVTQGRDRWTYAPVGPGTAIPLTKDLTVTMTTNFHDIDYPSGTASPTTAATKAGDGMKATWRYRNVRSRMSMGIEMPARANAGPIAARMSFFAPVSLLLFFTTLFTIVVLKKLSLHPMHYLFISAGFFAFHILLSYLVDIVNIHAAFWICAAVSVLLVVSYMRLVAGVRFAITYVAAAQTVYLVGFSYAFFWEGRTGLTVTIGAIATLFVLMQATGRLDWRAVFNSATSNGSAGWIAVPPAQGGPATAAKPVEGEA